VDVEVTPYTDAEIEWWTMSERDLGRLVAVLIDRFDEVIGPVVVDDVIRMRPITSVEELPVGISDQQETGTYGLVESADHRRFSYGVGPDSLKSIVHPPSTPVWTIRRRDGSIAVEMTQHPAPSRAVIAARACDLRALEILERTQTGGPHADPAFAANRIGLFTVAVDCTHPAPTCFCDTAGSGPAVDHGHDLALTELDAPNGVVYLVRAGSDEGRTIVDALHLSEAPRALVRQADLELRYAARELIRELPVNAAVVVRQPDHPHWDDVAARCLTCGNCTAVCPTCFCTDMDDQISLDGSTSTRTRVWDTCFSQEYSHLGAGPHRSSAASRYRQWLTHKLGTWYDHYDESGCVGCGRCITWCPVGIDLTAEIESLGRPVTTGEAGG